MNKAIVGITQGDSNGIGYEVIIKALSDPRILDMFTPVIYGSSKLFGFYKKTLPEMEQLECYAINSAAEARPKCINIINCLPDSVYAEPGRATGESAKAAIEAINRAVADLKDGAIDTLVTGPIDKRAMTAEGFVKATCRENSFMSISTSLLLLLVTTLREKILRRISR